MRDLELGDLLLAGISGGVWSDMSGTALGVNMLPARILHVHIMDTLDDLIRIDLQVLSVLLNQKEGAGGLLELTWRARDMMSRLGSRSEVNMIL
jgi:hypothetical protein